MLNVGSFNIKVFGQIRVYSMLHFPFGWAVQEGRGPVRKGEGGGGGGGPRIFFRFMMVI